MTGQLDLFHQPIEPEPAPDPDPEPQPSTPRRTQLTELPGETFEDMFAGPPSRTREDAEPTRRELT